MVATGAEWSDAEAVDALERNVWSMFSILGTGPGGTVVDTPTRLVVECPIPRPPYNAVWRFYDEGDRPVTEQVAELLDPMRERGVTAAWTLHPTTSPGVAEALADYGFERAENVYGMVADLDDVPAPEQSPAGIEVAEATAGDPASWVELVSWRYGLDVESSPYLVAVYTNAIGDHTRLWLAKVDGVAVSKVGLHVEDGVAGIYGVATTEEGRGKGLASLLTTTALQAARQADATRTVLHSTPMARSLYRRLGYRDVATFQIWAEPDSLHL